jgi:hypothetical protein
MGYMGKEKGMGDCGFDLLDEVGGWVIHKITQISIIFGEME